MKIILAIIAVFIIGILILGYLFVRWANSPEQVAETQQWHKEEAAKKVEDEQRKIEDDKRRAELDSELEAKRATLKLVIDESFSDNRFEFLDYKFQNSSQLKFENNQFSYYISDNRGSNPNNRFIFSKEDFAAEMDFRISGDKANTGIFWDAQPTTTAIRPHIRSLILRRVI